MLGIEKMGKGTEGGQLPTGMSRLPEPLKSTSEAQPASNHEGAKGSKMLLSFIDLSSFLSPGEENMSSAEVFSPQYPHLDSALWAGPTWCCIKPLD